MLVSQFFNAYLFSHFNSTEIPHISHRKEMLKCLRFGNLVRLTSRQGKTNISFLCLSVNDAVLRLISILLVLWTTAFINL